MKLKLKKISVLLIICFSIFISLFVELFIYNYDILKLDKKDRTITEVRIKENNTIIYDEKTNSYITKKNNSTLKFSHDKKYINKIIINYSTKENISFKLDYNTFDLYKKKVLNTKKFNSSFRLGYTVQNINKYVDDIKLMVNKKNVYINSIIIDNTFDISFYRIFFFSSIIFMILVFIYKRDFFLSKLHFSFLLIATIIGLNIILCSPTVSNLSYDDATHFKIVYELFGKGMVKYTDAANQIVNTLPFIDKTVNTKENVKKLQNYYNSNNDKFVIENNSKNGAIIPYNHYVFIPMAITVNICKFLHMPFTIMYKMGKLMNFSIYILLMFFAIKIVPIHKRLFLFLSLMPTFIYFSCQYTYDSTIISCFMLSYAILLNQIHCKKEISWSIMIFILCMLVACFAKAVYSPLILLALLIPKDKFKNIKAYKKFKIGIILIFILLMSSFVLPTLLSPNIVSDTRGGDTSTMRQMTLILSQPFSYIKLLVITVVSTFYNMFFGYKALGNFAYTGTINLNLYYLYLISLFVIAFIDNNEKESKFVISRKSKMLILSIILIIIPLIWTALYFSFTPVGLNKINGVQPRYFIPLLFPFLLIFRNNNIKNMINENKYNFCILFILISILSISVYQNILSRYCF